MQKLPWAVLYPAINRNILHSNMGFKLKNLPSTSSPKLKKHHRLLSITNLIWTQLFEYKPS